MTDEQLLIGFGFTGYRSFGSGEMQRISTMENVHLLAGPNNSGKSNVLGAAQRGLSSLKSGLDPDLRAEDHPTGMPQGGSDSFRIAVRTKLSDQLIEDAVGLGLGAHSTLLRETLVGPSFDPSGDSLWFEFEYRPDANQWQISGEQTTAFAEAPNGKNPAHHKSQIEDLSGLLTNSRGGDPIQEAHRVLSEITRRLNVTGGLPPVQTLTAFRRITAENDVDHESDFSGQGLIQRLAQLQNPDFSHKEDKQRFNEINKFVQVLFEDPDASVSVPHSRDTILVEHGGKRLPIENLGSGLHEVIVIAVAATVLTDHLVCVEEPEIHLHPSLQRQLLRYLAETTKNQYLIATHSAHLLDSARASISAVRIESNRSTISKVIEPAEVARLSAELGARASDLVQSNAVVWVEGPSDRVYLRKWLSLAAGDLIEGVDYSIMFYGGSLLSHLSASDPAVDEFISLPRINRNFAVLIDSDRKKPRDRLNPTKLRVRKEIEEADGVVWVTDGYTIENYVEPDLLKSAVTSAHPGAKCRWNGDRHKNPLGRAMITHRSAEVDKSAVAVKAVSTMNSENVWTHDLKAQVSRLTSMIRDASP